MVDSKYHVGDVLKIAAFKNCVFGIDGPMLKMKGRQVTIAKVGYDNYIMSHYYKIEEDSGEYWWDDTCFEPLEQILDLPEFDVAKSLDMLLL